MMATKKKTKKLEYQWSGDIRRIIPIKEDDKGIVRARITNELGKSHTYIRNSPEYAAECARLDEVMDGKITRELEALGWV